jgi:hypothetical protein
MWCGGKISWLRIFNNKVALFVFFVFLYPSSHLFFGFEINYRALSLSVDSVDSADIDKVSKLISNIFDQRFDLVVHRNNESFYNIPKDLKTFIYHYNFSKFIECNSELVAQNKDTYKAIYADMSANMFRYGTHESKVKLMAVFNDIVKEYEKMHLHYWLAGGTLLGMFENLVE